MSLVPNLGCPWSPRWRHQVVIWACGTAAQSRHRCGAQDATPPVPAGTSCARAAEERPGDVRLRRPEGSGLSLRNRTQFSVCMRDDVSASETGEGARRRRATGTGCVTKAQGLPYHAHFSSELHSERGSKATGAPRSAFSVRDGLLSRHRRSGRPVHFCRPGGASNALTSLISIIQCQLG